MIYEIYQITMKILSWNLGLCNLFVRTFLMSIFKNKTSSCKNIVSFINPDKNDIIFFQEVYGDTICILKKLLKNHYPFCISSINNGLVIFSKIDIELFKINIFGEYSLSNYITQTYNGFLAILIKNTNKILINIHLSCSICGSNKELKILKNYCDNLINKNYNIIIIGDFNIDLIDFKKINDIFDFNNEPELKYTYNHLINYCLDYGFFLSKNGNRILSSQVLKNYESDHFPIRVKF